MMENENLANAKKRFTQFREGLTDRERLMFDLIMGMAGKYKAFMKQLFSAFPRLDWHETFDLNYIDALLDVLGVPVENWPVDDMAPDELTFDDKGELVLEPDWFCRDWYFDNLLDADDLTEAVGNILLELDSQDRACMPFTYKVITPGGVE